jgi:hypothetical protein
MRVIIDLQTIFYTMRIRREHSRFQWGVGGLTLRLYITCLILIELHPHIPEFYFSENSNTGILVISRY